ncbi:MAG: hypothetical protein GY847_04815 [Proteobacteria bacterium]|nr:hypothetical protein [Pseudomonadota bacterium]
MPLSSTGAPGSTRRRWVDPSLHLGLAGGRGLSRGRGSRTGMSASATGC